MLFKNYDIMETIVIESTKYSPRAEIHAEGSLILEGRSILEDPGKFYQPLIDRIRRWPADHISVEIRLEYINTSSSKYLMNLLKAVKDHFNAVKVEIKWYYEDDDEDMLEMGKDFESILNIPVDFYSYAVDAA